LQLLSPSLVEGPASGQARDPQSGIVVSVTALPQIPGFSSLGPSKLAGSLRADNMASGVVFGEVRFVLAGAVRRCAVNDWRLEPR
jgi:hypothetical protein